MVMDWLFEEAVQPRIIIGACFVVFAVLIPYFLVLSEDLRNCGYYGEKDEVSFIVYLKKDSYRVLDILAIIYFFPLWLIYGIFYIVYLPVKWLVEMLERLMNVTIFTKKSR